MSRIKFTYNNGLDGETVFEIHEVSARISESEPWTFETIDTLGGNSYQNTKKKPREFSFDLVVSRPETEYKVRQLVDALAAGHTIGFTILNYSIYSPATEGMVGAPLNLGEVAVSVSPAFRNQADDGIEGWARQPVTVKQSGTISIPGTGNVVVTRSSTTQSLPTGAN